VNNDIARIASSTLDVDELRVRLRAMSEDELRKFGRAAVYMCSYKAQPTSDDASREEFESQLAEVRAEYRRRLKRTALAINRKRP
jgi:hypothetical protein